MTSNNYITSDIPVTELGNGTLLSNSEEESDEDDQDYSLLWIPYVLLTMFLLAMAFTSFFHYHVNNKGRYHSKVRVGPSLSKKSQETLSLPNKYRVTMSRNAKVSYSSFNVLDFIHKYYLYEEGENPLSENFVNSSCSKTKYDSISSKRNECSNDVIALDKIKGDVKSTQINGKSEVTSTGIYKKQSPSLPGYNDVYGDSNSYEMNPALPGSRDVYVYEAYTKNHALPESHDIYVNEAYDSNCDSDKSLIAENSYSRSADSNKKLYFYNDSFESQESPMTGGHIVPVVHAKTRSTKTVTRPASDSNSSRLSNKQLQKMVKKASSIRSVSGSIPEQRYPEPDILMHSVYAEKPRRKSPHRPQTLDLGSPVSKKERLHMKNRESNT